MTIPWILVSIAVGVVIFVLLIYIILKGKGFAREVDYRSYFTMGMIWLPLGIVFYLIFENFIGLWFLVMGLIYLFIGLKNRGNWGKPQKVSPTFQKALMIAVLIGFIFLVLGIIIYEIMA